MSKNCGRCFWCVCLVSRFFFVSWLFSQAMTGDPSLLLIKVLKCGKEEENKKCSNTNIKKKHKKTREKRDRGRLCV